MNMIQVLKRIANTSVNTFSLAIMSIRPLYEEIWTGNAKSRTYRAPRQERVKAVISLDTQIHKSLVRRFFLFASVRSCIGFVRS